MKLKNRKGSTLALTLIIFAVLMIFATFTLGFMVTENKQAMYHQNKTQAYYLARSGAEIVEAAIGKKLREIFDEEGVNGVNRYLEDLEYMSDTERTIILGDDLSGIESVELSIINKNEDKVLAIDSYAEFSGVKQSVRKIMWSDLITTSSTENLIKYEGAPLVAIEEAWRTDNQGDTDLSDPSKNNGKKYAEIVGENSIFKQYNFPTAPTWEGQIQENDIILSGNITIFEDTDFNGNVRITGNLKVEGKVNINIRGSLTIENSMSINGETDSTHDNLSFHIYNESNNILALDIDPSQSGVIKANFYINKGRTDIDLKKAYLEGNIVSNDKYNGESKPSGYDNYNVRIIAEDSSNKINFNGSIYAPNSYVLIGGNVNMSDKSAILQDGMILGKYIQVKGNNRNKNFDFLDFILAKAQDGTILPVETEVETDVSVLRFHSYFSEIAN